MSFQPEYSMNFLPQLKKGLQVDNTRKQVHTAVSPLAEVVISKATGVTSRTKQHKKTRLSTCGLRLQTIKRNTEEK